MDPIELQVEMLRQNVNRKALAEALDITKSALSKKLNGTNDFSRKDIAVVKEILHLSPKRIDDIFFK